MRRHLSVLLTAGLLAGALALQPSHQDLRGKHQPSARQLEIARLRAHFDSVDAELRSAALVRATPSRQAGRATLIRWLREYRDAGRFPQNDRFPIPTPFFRDDQGTLCAMAYLIARSGRADIVDRVARTRNNAYIAELSQDAGLQMWLDSVGLSVAEAARIQPTYGPHVDADNAVSDDYAITSVLVSGTSLATLGLNLIAPSRGTGWAGVIAGTAAVIAGVANFDGNNGTQNVAAANALIGVGAIAVGLYRMLDQRSARLVEPHVVATPGGPRFGLAIQGSF